MPHVYDKAKYHDDSCLKGRLPDGQSFVHTGLFVAWLVNHDLVKTSPGYDDWVIANCKARLGAPTGYYEWNDGVLLDEMLTDEGNAFAQSYFDFENGQYLADYGLYVAFGLPSVFQVPNTWEAYNLVESFVDARYRQFKGEDVPMPPEPTRAPLKRVRMVLRWPWRRSRLGPE